MTISPKQSENEWYRWLEDIQDWCISRQLWWGHRCPAYFVRVEGLNQDVSRSIATTMSFTNLLSIPERRWQELGRRTDLGGGY